MRSAHERQLFLAPDLRETLAAVDQFEIDALKKIDDYISQVGLAAPTENISRLLDGYKEEVVTELNLQAWFLRSSQQPSAVASTTESIQ